VGGTKTKFIKKNNKKIKMTKTIIVTGISGSGTKEFCKKYDEKNDKKTKIYHTGDMIEEMAWTINQTPPENLLNLDPQELSHLRDNVFQKILKDISINNHLYERIIIDTHAQFFWDNSFDNAFNLKHLKKINPDLFITIIDRPSAIKENQQKSAQGQSQNHSIKELLYWQNIEVNITKSWAELNEKPMYVLPSRQEPEIIDSLLENSFLIYFSMPMTDADPEAKLLISHFKEKLLNIGRNINGLPTPIVDPRHIDLESDKNLDKETILINEHQTVHRDLNWYIPQSTHIIICYPPESHISLGVSHEQIRAHESGKHVFIVNPKERLSPFILKSHILFKTGDEFFQFFPEHMKKTLEFYKRK